MTPTNNAVDSFLLLPLLHLYSSALPFLQRWEEEPDSSVAAAGDQKFRCLVWDRAFRRSVAYLCVVGFQAVTTQSSFKWEYEPQTATALHYQTARS